MKAHRNLKTVLLYIFISLATLIILAPGVWVAINSIKPQSDIFSVPFRFFPQRIILSNYEDLFKVIPFARYLLNSFIITIGVTSLAIIISSLAGFSFAKYEFPYKRLLFTIVVASLMLPIYVLLIPLYLFITKLGLMDTYIGVIVPFAAMGAVSGFGVFLMRQHMLSLPTALLDAARIDGSSEFRLYWQFSLPTAKPALVTLGIISFMLSWNNFLWPLVVLKSSEKFTLTIGLFEFRSIYAVNWGAIMAGSFLATIPILVLFLLLQKYYVSGITFGALKE